MPKGRVDTSLVQSLGGVLSKPGGGGNEQQGKGLPRIHITFVGLPMAAVGMSAYLFHIHFITGTLGGNRMRSFFVAHCTEDTQELCYLAREHFSRP